MTTAASGPPVLSTTSDHGPSATPASSSAMDLKPDPPDSLTLDRHPSTAPSLLPSPPSHPTPAAAQPSPSVAPSINPPAEVKDPPISKTNFDIAPLPPPPSLPHALPSVSIANITPKPTAKTKALRVARASHRRSRPHATNDLLRLFELDSLVATVARNDPVTGAKINRLRKSYEGQLKTFGLAGRNKAVKHEEQGYGRGLGELIAWPDDEWYAQHVSGGKDLASGLSATSEARLARAFQLEPGTVPKSEEWETILGLEKPKAAVVGPEGKGRMSISQSSTIKPIKTNGIAALALGANGTPTTAASAASLDSDGNLARPSRSGKRRRYNEESFEGYGEGFVDDRDREDDSSDGASKYSAGGTKRRKRKSSYNATSPTMQDRPSSFGSSGPHSHVGRGIGAYAVR